MDPIRFGIIGLGVQGSTYAALLGGDRAPALCTLGAVCTTSPEKAERWRAEHPAVPCYADWKALVTGGAVDAVIPTVPHYLHHEIAIFCFEHGVHVLLEKPAGVRAKDVLAMNACAAAHPDVAFGILFNQRANPLYGQLRALVQSGELGEIRRSHWMINTWWRPDSYYKQSAWRATWGGEGGGVLVNQAAHQLDLWQWICGVPSTVYSKNLNGCHRGITTENDVTMVTGYPNGATGSFITCTHDALGTDRFEIDLSGGKIVVENGQTATVYRLNTPEPALNAALSAQGAQRLPQEGLYTQQTLTADESIDGHAVIIENFARHILQGTPLLAPGPEGLRGVELANASQLSSWLGREVQNPVDPELYAAELNKRIAAEGLYPVRE